MIQYKKQNVCLFPTSKMITDMILLKVKKKCNKIYKKKRQKSTKLTNEKLEIKKVKL